MSGQDGKNLFFHILLIVEFHATKLCRFFLRNFKPVNTSAEKCPVGRPKKKPVDQPLTMDCTRLTIAISH